MNGDTTAYLAAVHEAYQQLTFGTDVEKIGALVDRLEKYSPEHAVVPMLRRKLARLATGPASPALPDMVRAAGGARRGPCVWRGCPAEHEAARTWLMNACTGR